MKRWRLIFTIIILQFLSLQYNYAQNEGNVWYFGQNAGLDFNNFTPTVLTDGQLNTFEGCASIADANGNLLFYTDGVKVWNKLHQVMPNGTGLKGDPSSTQSAVIVPYPQNSNLYYIFTVGSNGNPDGMQYSLLDMSLNNDLGDIVSKNTLLFTPSTEKITAVAHANGTDVWIIGHKWFSSEFYAYLITSTGINTTAIISDIGVVHNGSSFNSHGYLKASPQGNKIVAGIGSLGMAQVFDFDNNTGVLSNPLTISGLQYVYGVEFSQNNKYLYLTRRYYNNLYQYNLQAGSNTAILNSQYIINTGNLGALQIAPDGKIYVGQYDDYLDVIHNPNGAGSSCNYQSDAIYLDGKFSTLGLPTFNQSFFKGFEFTYQNDCLGSPTVINSFNTQGISTISWDFGDGTTGITGLNPTHIYNNEGSFTITANVNYVNGTSRSFQQSIIIIASPPQFTLNADTLICEGEIINLQVSHPNSSYLWQDGSIDNNFTVSEIGTYWVKITNNCGTSHNEVSIYPDPIAVNLGLDTILCQGQELVLDASYTDVDYLWQDNSTNPTYTVSTAGKYWVSIRNTHCEAYDTITVSYLPDLTLNLQDTLYLCPNTSISLDVSQSPESMAKYQWQDGSNNPTFDIHTVGQYWVEVWNDCELLKDTITVLWNEAYFLDLGTDRKICHNANEVLDVSLAEATYLWQDGSTNPIFEVDTTGIYTVEITYQSCTVTKSVEITEIPELELNLGNKEVLCEGEILVLEALNPDNNTHYLWSDGSNEPNLIVEKTGTYWVAVQNTCEHKKDTIRVVFIENPEVNLGRDTSICLGQTLYLDAQNSEANYLWQDGSKQSFFEVNETGTYSVIVQRGKCEVYDEIFVEVVDCQDELFIPNVITPNGDGKNDYFIIEQINGLGWELQIFHRNGTEIYHSKNYKNDWRAEGFPSNTYFYTLKDPRGKKNYKGWIKVLK